MAYLRQPKTEAEIRKLGVNAVRESYKDLAKDYNKIIDGNVYYCHKCNKFLTTEAFYNDNSYASGVYPICKKCSLEEATDYDKKEKVYIDNRQKTINVFRKMDLPFIDSLYKSALKQTQAQLGEKNRSTAYQHMLTMVKSLFQYKGMHFSDSEFDLDDDEVENEDSDPESIADTKKTRKLIKTAKKRFGDYTREELYWLENEYQDWIARYPCDSKAQERLFQTLCCQELEADQARRSNRPTKDIDKAIQDTMTALGIKPSQSKADALADTLTFGQLIEKWETERPIPEPDEDFKDCDRVGTYIDVFFKGHLSKMMGLKNAFSNLYDKYMQKYTVTKPEIDDEEEEALFNQIFGSKLDEDG